MPKNYISEGNETSQEWAAVIFQLEPDDKITVLTEARAELLRRAISRVRPELAQSIKIEIKKPPQLGAFALSLCREIWRRRASPGRTRLVRLKLAWRRMGEGCILGRV